MREGLPLFPTKDGRPVEKRDVVKCIEATIEAKGDPLVTDTGAKMYGGHSFRVSGARMLATLGVEISKIMILARWASAVVFRYVHDAPLVSLPAEVVALRNQSDLQGTI